MNNFFICAIFFSSFVWNGKIWELISGSLSSHTPPVYGEKMNYSSGFPGSRHGPSSFLVERDRSVFIFGGKSCKVGGCQDLTRVYRNDLWQFSLKTKKWRFLSGNKSNILECNQTLFDEKLFTFNEINQPPCSGWGTSFVTLPTNSSLRESGSLFYLFGGYGNYGDKSYNGIWEYSLEKNMWRKIKDDKIPDPYGSIPDTFNDEVVPSQYHCASVQKISDDLVIHFGGTNYHNGNQETSNEYYLYNTTSNQWKFMGGRLSISNDPGIIPPVSSKGVFNSSFFPGARGCFASATLNGNYYIFGGFAISLEDHVWNDLWVWNSTNQMWAWLSGDPVNNNIAGKIQTFQSYDPLNHPPALYNCEGTGLRHNGISDELVFFLGKEIVNQPIRVRASTNQVWMYSITFQEWKFMNGTMSQATTPTASMIGGRNSFSSFSDSMDRIYVFFGSDDTETNFYDSGWRYKGIENIKCNDRGVFLLPSSSSVSCECFPGYLVSNDCQPCDSQTYCTGHGECSYDSNNQPGVCECYENYESLNCAVYQCFGIAYTSSNVCSNQQGNCSDINKCDCQDDFYLNDCRTYITGAILSISGSLKYLTIPYIVSLDFVPSVFLALQFSCSNAFEYSGFLFGTDPICYFIVNELSRTTEALIVKMSDDYKISLNDKVFVKPVSNSSDIIEVLVVETDEVANKKKDDNPNSGLSTEMISVIAIGSVLTLCFFVCLVSFFLISTATCICCVCLFLCLSVVGVGGSLRLSQNKLNSNSFSRERLLEQNIIHEHDSRHTIDVKNLKINNDLFKIKYAEIELISMIGSGGSGANIFKVRWRRNQICAYKKFPVNQVVSSEQKFLEFEKEVEILKGANHPNVLSCFGAIFEPRDLRVGIVMEFCEKGDIFTFLENYRKLNDGEEYSLEKKLKMLCSVASGMEYLHSRNIIHRDLKCENVLIDGMERCKIIDFGLSKMILSDNSNIQTKQIGTSLYMAPEVLSGVYDNKVDVFSFGILIFVVLTESQPYQKNESFIELKVAKDPNFRPNAVAIRDKKGCGEWVSELAVQCWKHDPKKRPSFQEICERFEKYMGAKNILNGGDDDNKRRMSMIIGDDFMVEEEGEGNDDDDDDDGKNQRKGDDVVKSNLKQPLLSKSY